MRPIMRSSRVPAVRRCPPAAARPALLAAITAVVAALAAGAVAPTVAVAQKATAGAAQDPQATYTVRQGDSLWEIARQVLGDPNRWREIYDLNAGAIEDPKKLPPGLVLKLPAGTAAPAPAPAPAPAAPAAAPVAAPAAEKPAPSESPAVVVPTAEPAPGRQEGPTVFASDEVRRATAPKSSGVVLMRPLAVRRGEFESAPFLTRPGGPTGSGMVLDPVDASNLLTAKSLAGRKIQIRERIAIRPPAGPTPTVGEYFVSYRLGDVLDGRQVVVPTGVLRVDESVRGRAPVVRLMREFDNVTAGQRVMRYEGIESDSIRPIDVTVGRTTRVLGIFGNDIVPGLQNLLFFPLSSKDGLRPGDQLTLFHAARKDEGSLIPEVDIARVTLLRVTEFGATGMVIGQASSRFEPGTYARVSARLP